jgi:hypothetical protein
MTDAVVDVDPGGAVGGNWRSARRCQSHCSPVTRHVDNSMVKAIARAFRWRDMLESGEYATIREIANAEKISESYVGRVLRLTLLTPDAVEAILSGSSQPGCG